MGNKSSRLFNKEHLNAKCNALHKADREIQSTINGSYCHHMGNNSLNQVVKIPSELRSRIETLEHKPSHPTSLESKLETAKDTLAKKPQGINMGPTGYSPKDPEPRSVRAKSPSHLMIWGSEKKGIPDLVHKVLEHADAQKEEVWFERFACWETWFHSFSLILVNHGLCDFEGRPTDNEYNWHVTTILHRFVPDSIFAIIKQNAELVCLENDMCRFQSFFFAASQPDHPATVQTLLKGFRGDRFNPLMAYYSDPRYIRFHNVLPEKYRDLVDFEVRTRSLIFRNYVQRLSALTVESLRDRELTLVFLLFELDLADQQARARK